MSARPNILITPSTQKQGAEFLDASISLSDRYPAAVLAGGGVPWIAACIPDPDYVTNAVRRADGVLLTGGDDLQPRLYRDDVPARLGKTVVSVSPARDLFEMLLVRAALSEQKPILAICRGHQLLNVALGGTLIVDIPLQLPLALKHNRPDRRAEPVHAVTVGPGTLLARATARTRLGVNSTHHQAVEQVAEPLRVSAQSEDGIVEGLELKPEARRMSPFLASVQFHPERLYDRYGEFLDLFRAFIRACRSNGRGGP